MDGMLNEKMKALLSDPEAMSRVMEVAGSLFSGTGGESAKGGSPDLSSLLQTVMGSSSHTAREEQKAEPASLPVHTEEKGEEKREQKGERASLGTDEDRIRLLSAICPFLNPQRREAAQSMIRILKLISMADAAGLWKRS